MRLLLIILCFFITSCNMDCVEPGLQSRDISFHVEVPLHKDDANSIIHWVDSEQVISNKESIKFNVNGEIDFCPKKKGKNPVEVLVPAVFCDDGSEPNYDKAKYINRVEDNFGKDSSSDLCSGGFQQKDIKRRYIDSKIKVNPGDKLTFSLIPRKMKINCNTLLSVTLDQNYYSDNKCKQKASANTICKGGTFFIHDDENKCVSEALKSLEDAHSGNNKNEYDILVGNGYTPYDNKVHFNVDHIEDNSPWKIGSLLDLRRHKVALNKVVPSKDKNKNDSEEKKYNSYELNCYNQSICYNSNGMWGETSASKQNCVSSIRYGKYDVDNKCNMYSYFEAIEDRMKSDQNKKNSWNENDITEQDTWAEALIAKISTTSIVLNDSYDDMNYDSKGTQCLPKGNSGICTDVTEDFKDFSLKLDHEYEVQSHVEHESSVMLAIANNGDRSANRGGYHVKVSKSCISNKGDKLYLYIGNDRPKGDKIEGYEVAKISAKIGDGIKYYKQNEEYTIEAYNLLENKPQKIYFGVDLRDIEKSDITDSNRDYYENNQYTITLNLKKNVNNFLSSSVNSLMQFVKGSESKGDGIANTVKETYEGYRKGLILTVRALLILYLIFSVIGYMLGTVRLTNYDFIIRITKIAFIVFAFSDKSWEILGTNLSMFFIDGSNQLVNNFSGFIADNNNNQNLAFLDSTVGIFFTGETWLKFLSLIFSGPFGFIAFGIILHATFVFFKCIMGAIIQYIIAILLCGFLLSLTPLFIVFILFQQTKLLFDGWIKSMAHVALQPIILFLSLSLLNQLMYSVLYNLTNFAACNQCVMSVYIFNTDFCIFHGMLPVGYNPDTSIENVLDGRKTNGFFAALPIDLIQAFIYLIIAYTMKSFVELSETIAQAILNSGPGIAASILSLSNNASQSMLSTVGLDKKTQDMIKKIKAQPSRDPPKIKFQSGSEKDLKPDTKEDKNTSELLSSRGSSNDKGEKMGSESLSSRSSSKSDIVEKISSDDKSID